jgi:hypothetical protein
VLNLKYLNLKKQKIKSVRSVWCCRVSFLEAEEGLCYGSVEPIISLKRDVVLFISSSSSSSAQKMGTLTNCSLVPLNSEFRFKPVRHTFKNKIQCHSLNSHLSKWGKLKHVHFDKFRCFSINNKDGVDGEGENGNNNNNNNNDSKSNVTTVLPDEDRGFNSDKSTTPSTSQRVHFYTLFCFMD